MLNILNDVFEFFNINIIHQICHNHLERLFGTILTNIRFYRCRLITKILIFMNLNKVSIINYNEMYIL